MPPPREVPVSIKAVQLDGNTKLFQCHCSAHLRFEAEYGLKRGTTSNAYLLLDGSEGVLVDVPRKEYLEVFCALFQLQSTYSVLTCTLQHGHELDKYTDRKVLEASTQRRGLHCR